MESNLPQPHSEPEMPLALVKPSPYREFFPKWYGDPGWVRGTVYPGEALHRVLYATQYTRHIDRYGYVRLRNWRVYGERGLSGTPVSVWVYDGSIRLEYEAVLLSAYSFEWESDGKHIREVTNPKLTDTHFRSPQLSLFELSPDEWLLCLRASAYSSRPRLRTQMSAQLPLPAELLAVV